ncbi:SDR family NAD(P)-dependent oxidoreductase [Microbacterium sp.]|uniref:SDR family NAD(P)-dependent oxidoreductase n=1 Tax=Microbacterium sp. TaxID=51671 RepID=UPI002637C548|nr:SDR family NAD(P)-dependent oxidoreductase [Microbacterium sp.]
MQNVREFILAQHVAKNIDRAQTKKLLREISDAAVREDIAIIGLAGRFASAGDEEQYWDSLVEGANCLRDFPQLRKDDQREILRNPAHAELLLGAPVAEADLDRIYDLSGYMDRIDTFDAGFFSIPPLEADYMDPHQRVALEIAYEAMENAGYGGEAMRGSRTGVFVGRDQTNYSYYKMFSERSPMQLSGSWEGMVASRISYLFDFTGPSMMTDTACSAGAVCIHQAIQSLTLGECDVALAGGINLSSGGEVRPEHINGASMDNVVSSASTVRTFDARADGTLWGEGAGIVVLKPLARALADGDHIRAVIKGTAINNDGTSNSITAPNALMQERVILDAWSRASVDPETISYIEAHGTGTVLGDPIEAKGLTNAFRRHTQARQFCGIGSLKTSMGHMVAASGVAAVTKVVKMLEAGQLAPSANFASPNPYIDFTGSPLYVNDRLSEWEPVDGVRRAGVSSFGFIRTNAHMVLEEAPAYRPSEPAHSASLFTLSAKTPTALRQLVDRFARTLENTPFSLNDICATVNLGRGHYEHRLLIVARSVEEIRDRLREVYSDGIASRPARAVFAGSHALVSAKKRDREPGELTAEERRSITADAATALGDYLRDGDVRHLERLGQCYVAGAQVDFAEFYPRESRRRVPLPTYPYAPDRHWAPILTSRVQLQGPATSFSHPILGTIVSSEADEIVFTSTMSPRTHWVLDDHRINRTAVIPGTTYLEMARAAYAHVTGAEHMRLSQVFFLTPLSLDEDESAVVTTTLTRDGNEYAFRIAGARDGESVPLVEGRIGASDSTVQRRELDLIAIAAAAAEVHDPYDAEPETDVFQFGPRWDCVRAAWIGETESTARIRLRDGVSRESEIALHPAMLDHAVNLVSQMGEHTYLPYVYKELVLHGPMPDEFHSVITKRRGADGDEVITYDVDLVDAEGNVFAQVRDYSVKRVDWSRFQLDSAPRSLEFSWREVPDAEQVAVSEGSWVLVICDSPAGRQWEQTFEAVGRAVEVVRLTGDIEADATSFTAVTDRVAAGAEGIVWAFDGGDGQQATDARQLFSFVRHLVDSRVRPSEGLKIAVRDAWSFSADDRVAPAAAAAAALGIVVGQEHENLLVDVVSAGRDADNAVLVREIVDVHRATPRTVVGSRVLIRRADFAAGRTVEDHTVTGATIVITGGTGGLGLALAERFAAAGAARLLLLSRRTPDEATRARIDAIPGARWFGVDLAREDDVHAFTEWLRTEQIAIDIVLHAAGIAGAGFLARKEEAEFAAVLAPKVSGAHAATQLLTVPDQGRIVFFSSITSLLGGPGQGDYCAANAYMDGLAADLRSRGVHAASVRWPAWSGAGMAVEHGVDDQAPVRSISLDDGFQWLLGVLAEPADDIVPSTFDTRVLADEAAGLPFEIPAEVAAQIAAKPENIPSGDEITSVQLTGIADPTPVQVAVGSCYGAVLGLSKIDAFASFQELGGNSLVTTQLLGVLGERYPGVVDIADLFSYSTVVDLADFIASSTGQEEPATESPRDDLLGEVLAELRDDELSAMFANEGVASHE